MDRKSDTSLLLVVEVFSFFFREKKKEKRSFEPGSLAWKAKVLPG